MSSKSSSTFFIPKISRPDAIFFALVDKWMRWMDFLNILKRKKNSPELFFSCAKKYSGEIFYTPSKR